MRSDDHEAYRVEVMGTKDEKPVEYTVGFEVHPNKKFQLGAEAVCTGIPSGWAAWMIGRGEIKQKGVLFPERCIETEQCFKMMKVWGMPVWAARKEYI